MMSRVLFAALIAVAAALCWAQQKPASAAPVPPSALALVPAPAINDALHLEAHIGSFKMVPKGDSFPAGRLSMDFRGTVLISDLAPGSYLQTSGKVQKEYDSHGKMVFFGQGKLVVVGRFRNCEWFGRNLVFDFKGSAIIRMIAEYDDALKTGTYSYGSGKKDVLYNGMTQLNVPIGITGSEPVLTRDEFEKQQKKGGG
jgi:hypothetical protein